MERFRTERLKLIGMHCTSCAVTIEKKLRSTDGTVSATVNFAGEEAVVKYDLQRTKLKDIIRAVRDVGYDVFKEEFIIVIKGLISAEEERAIKKG